MAELNTKTSVVDFLKSSGQDSSFGARKNLAVSQGVVKNAAEYTGSASQNTALLRSLQSPAKGNAAPTQSSGNIGTLEEADSFINENNVDRDEPAAVRTSFQRSEDFFKEISDLVTKDLGDAPEAPSFTELFNEQREKFGLDAIEQNIAQYTAEKRDIEARLRQRTQAEEGKSVALNVIEGRVDETTRQERENLDFVEREIAYNTDRANSAYNAINTMISLTEKDFNAASKQYESEFSRRKDMYTLATNAEDREYNRDRDAQEDARANAEIIVNTAVTAGKTFEDLDEDVQLSLQKMGLQTGLGQHIFEDMITAGINAKDQEILTTVVAEDKNSVTVVYADGTTDVIATRGGAKPKTTTEDKKEAAAQEFELAIEYADSFAGTDEELKRDLLKNSDLTATDINSIIATRSVGEEKIQSHAVSLVEEYFDKRLLRSRDFELSDAKKKALEDIDEYVQEVDGRELTPADEQKLRDKINSITLSDINID
jgi:lipoate-protein ligase A